MPGLHLVSTLHCGSTRVKGRVVVAYEFLRNHPAHGNADDVQFALVRPAEVVEQLEDVFRHLGSGIAH